jgi:hypothetical protein
MVKKISMKGMYFTFYEGNKKNPESFGMGDFYTHPAIIIYKVSDYYPERTSPYTVLEFTGQNDSKRGFNIFATYSLRAEINFSSYGMAPYAFKVLSRLGLSTEYDYPANILGLSRMLLKLGIERRVIREIRDERGRMDRKHIPARFRNSAQVWYDAKMRGLDLKKTA